MATNFLEEEDDLKLGAPSIDSPAVAAAVAPVPTAMDVIESPEEAIAPPPSPAPSSPPQPIAAPSIELTETQPAAPDLSSIEQPANPQPAQPRQAPSQPEPPDFSAALEERNWLMENPYQPVHHQRSTDPKEEAWLQQEGHRRQEASRRERLERLGAIDKQLEKTFRQQGIEYAADESGLLQPARNEDGSLRYKPQVTAKLSIDPETNEAYRLRKDERGNLERLNILEVGELGRDYKRDDKDGPTLGEYYVETEKGRHYLGQRDDAFREQRYYQSMRDLAQSEHSVDHAELSAVRSAKKALRGDHGDGWKFEGTPEERDAELKGQIDSAMEAQKKDQNPAWYSLSTAAARQQRIQMAEEEKAAAEKGRAALVAKQEYDQLDLQERTITDRMLQRKQALAQMNLQLTARKYINRTGDTQFRAYQSTFSPDEIDGAPLDGGKPIIKETALLDRAEALGDQHGRTTQDAMAHVIKQAKQQGYDVPGAEDAGKRLYLKKNDGSISWGTGNPLPALNQALQNGDITPEQHVKLFRQHEPKGPAKDNGTGRVADTFWRTAIHTSNTVNQSLAGLARFFGANDIADHFAGEAAVGTHELKSENPVATNRALDDSWTATAAEVGGNLLGSAPALAAGGPAGAIGGAARLGTLLPRIASMFPMALQGAGQAYESTWQEAKSSGKTDAEANAEGNSAILKTLPALALYGVAGAATDKLMRPLTRVMPILETPFARAAGAAAVDLPLNIAADAVVMAAQGENPLNMRAADLATTIAFSFLPSMQHYEAARYLPTAKSMADGSHPEVQMLRALSADPSRTRAERKQDFDKAAELNRMGKRFLSELGAHPGRAAVEHLEATNRLRDLDAAPDSASVRDERAQAVADANRSLTEIVRSSPGDTRRILSDLIRPERGDDTIKLIRGTDPEGPSSAVLAELGRSAIDSGIVLPSKVEALRKSLEHLPENQREAVLRHSVGTAVLGDSYAAIFKGDALDTANLGYLKALQENGILIIDPETNGTKFNAQHLFLLPQGMRERVVNTPEYFDHVDAPENLRDLKRIIIEGHTGLAGAEPNRLPDLGPAASERPAMPSQHPTEGPGFSIREDAEGNFTGADLNLPANATPDQLSAIRTEIERATLPEQARADLLNQIDDLSEPSRPAPEPEPAKPASEPIPPSATTASIPIMITRAMDRQLRQRGYTPEQIHRMKPAEAHAILSDPNFSDYGTRPVKSAEESARAIAENASTEDRLRQSPEGAELLRQELKARAAEESAPPRDELDELPMAYSRSQGEPKKYSKAQAEEIVAKATTRFKNLPEIEIVQSYDDLPVSQSLRDRYRKEGVEGYWKDGKVTLIADKMKSPSHVVQTALHEIIGHHGFRGAFGDRYPQVVDQLTRASGEGVAKVAKANGLDIREPAQRREAAEEFLADMAGGKAKPAARERLVNWMKRKLEQFFPGVKFQEDYVQTLLRHSREYVEKGGAAAPASGDTRFARAQVGMKLREVGPDFVRDDVEPELMNIRTNNMEIAKNAAAIFQRWPESITAADGSDILLSSKEGGSIGARVRHLIFNNSDNTVNAEKAKWLPMVPETVKNAAVRLVDQESGYRIYVREYRDGNKHMVVIRPDGLVTSQKAFKGSLITQFKDNPGSRQGHMVIDWARPEGAEMGPGRSQGNPRPTPTGSTRPDARQPEFQGDHTPKPSNNQPENKSGEPRFSRGTPSESEGNPYRGKSGKLIIPERASSIHDPAQKSVEDRMRAVADDSPKADVAYNAIPAAHGGKVIGTDIARELLPEYGSKEGKIKYTTATGRVGAAYAQDRLWREIENRGDRKELIFTAGGVAAGKSISISPETVKATDLIFDGTLRDSAWAIKSIQHAIDNGWKVALNYVQRPLDLALEGVIERADRTGRIGPIAGMPKAHLDAQDSFLKVAKHFEGSKNVDIAIALNEGVPGEGRPAKALSLADVDKGGEYSYRKSNDSDPRASREASSIARDVQGFEQRGRDSVERIFRSAVESGRYDQRILDLLAKGDERLERIARGESVEPRPESPDGDIRFSRGEPAADAPSSRPSGEEPSLTPEQQLLHGAVVKAGPKAWRRLFYGAADILEGTKGLEHLGKAVRNQVDRAREIQGKITGFYRKLESKEGSTAFKAAEEEVTSYYKELDRAPEAAAKLYPHLSPAAKEHIDIWRGITEWFAQQSGRLGVKTQDANGKWRDMREISDYHPRAIKPEYLEAIRDPSRFKKRFHEVVEEMKKAGMARSEDEVISMFKQAGFTDTSRGDHFSNIEKARVLKLPHKLYDYSFDARRRYVMQAAERLSQVEFYGQRTDTQKDLFQKAADLAYAPSTQEYISAVGDAALGIRKNTMLNRSMALLNSIATGTMLGNPMSATLNLVSGSAYNFATTGFRNNLRVLMELPHYAKAAAEARDKGVLLDDLMDLQADTDASGSSLAQRVNKLTNISLKLGGFNAAEDIVRVTGYVASKHWLRGVLADRLNNPASRSVQNAERFLKNISVDADKLYREGGTGPETDRFYRAVSNASQGGYRIDQTPIYMNTPLGKFLTKYQKWGSQASRHAVKTVINPLIGKDGPVDAKPLFRYLVATGVAGGILAGVREGIFGSTDPEASFDEIAKTWSEDQRRAIGLAVGKLTGAMILSGAGGMVMNYAQMAGDVFERSRFKNPMDPPGLSVVKNTGEQFLRLVEQGTLTPKDLNDYLRAQLSIYRTSAGMAGRAGLFPIEKARQNRAWLNAQTRRYADEVGIEAKRTSIGRIGRTEKSPVLRDITDALMIGDAIGAKAAMQKYIRQGESMEQRKILERSLKQSIKSRQPLRVGSAGEARREAFLKWAQRRLSTEDLQRAKEIDGTYRRTAERIGLM